MPPTFRFETGKKGVWLSNKILTHLFHLILMRHGPMQCNRTVGLCPGVCRLSCHSEISLFLQIPLCALLPKLLPFLLLHRSTDLTFITHIPYPSANSASSEIIHSLPPEHFRFQLDFSARRQVPSHLQSILYHPSKASTSLQYESKLRIREHCSFPPELRDCPRS